MIKYTDEYIERLLCRFMNGESSLEEETQLGEYFRTNAVRKEWEIYREMFAYFDNGMEEKTNGVSDVPSESPVQNQIIKQAYTKKAVGNVSMALWRYIAVVASVVVVLAITYTREGENMMTAVKQHEHHSLVDMDSHEAYRWSAADNNTSVNSHAAEAGPAAGKRHSSERALNKNAVADCEMNCAIDSVKEELRRAELEIAMAENNIAELRGMAIVADILAHDMQACAQDDIQSGGYESDMPLLDSRIRTLVMP